MRLVLLSVLAAGAALADIPSPETRVCDGKELGTACTTLEGQPGTCTEVTVQRPDFSSGFPPTRFFPRQVVLCVATAKAAEKSAAPWLGAALAFLAVCLALATRKAPVQSAA